MPPIVVMNHSYGKSQGRNEEGGFHGLFHSGQQ